MKIREIVDINTKKKQTTDASLDLLPMNTRSDSAIPCAARERMLRDMTRESCNAWLPPWCAQCRLRQRQQQQQQPKSVAVAHVNANRRSRHDGGG